MGGLRVCSLSNVWHEDPEVLFNDSTRCRVEGLKKDLGAKQQAARQKAASSEKPFEDPGTILCRSDRTAPGPSKYLSSLKLGLGFKVYVGRGCCHENAETMWYSLQSYCIRWNHVIIPNYHFVLSMTNDPCCCFYCGGYAYVELVVASLGLVICHRIAVVKQSPPTYSCSFSYSFFSLLLCSCCSNSNNQTPRSSSCSCCPSGCCSCCSCSCSCCNCHCC